MVESAAAASLRPSPRMRIIVKTGAGGTFYIEAEGGDSVQSLREKVFRESQVPPAQQRLVAPGGGAVEDGRTLADYHLEMDSELQLIPLPPQVVVKLNVGGTRFDVFLSTLARCRDSNLFGMFEGLEQGGRAALTLDGDGVYFIDHDGESFRDVLSYLRAMDPTVAAAAANEPPPEDAAAE